MSWPVAGNPFGYRPPEYNGPPLLWPPKLYTNLGSVPPGVREFANSLRFDEDGRKRDLTRETTFQEDNAEIALRRRFDEEARRRFNNMYYDDRTAIVHLSIRSAARKIAAFMQRVFRERIRYMRHLNHLFVVNLALGRRLGYGTRQIR